MSQFIAPGADSKLSMLIEYNHLSFQIEIVFKGAFEVANTLKLNKNQQEQCQKWDEEWSQLTNHFCDGEWSNQSFKWEREDNLKVIGYDYPERVIYSWKSE